MWLIFTLLVAIDLNRWVYMKQCLVCRTIHECKFVAVTDLMVLVPHPTPPVAPTSPCLGVLRVPSLHQAFALSVSSTYLAFPFSFCLVNACFSLSHQLEWLKCWTFGQIAISLLLMSQVLTKTLGQGGGNSLISLHQVICRLVTVVQGPRAATSQAIYGGQSIGPRERSRWSW